MTKTTTRIKKSDTFVPTSLRQADALMGKLGNTQNEINEIEKSLKEAISKLKAEALKKLQPLIIERDKQVNALFSFANPRKKDLTKEARSIILSAGVFGWRMTTPRVEMKGSVEETISLLKKTGNSQFVRVKEEIDRQALLAERPIVSGIKYVQSDEFFAVPKQECKKPKTFTHAIDR